MEKKQNFLIRLFSFLFISIIAPATYLIVRFNLFQCTSKLQIGLWGCIVFLILGITIKILISFYLEGMKTKYSIWKQIITGVSKLILPLLTLLVLLVWLKDNIGLLIETLAVLIPCELIAIIINPLPKWCFDNNVEGIGEIADRIFAKKGENK